MLHALKLRDGPDGKRSRNMRWHASSKRIFAVLRKYGGPKTVRFMHETLETADDHWDGVEHEVDGLLGSGVVHSHHRQAITDPGRLEVTARADDGVIEAVQDPLHHHRHGVQWHPERTRNDQLGQALFTQLVAACAPRG